MYASGVKTGRVVKNKSPVKVKYEARDDDLEDDDEDGPTSYGSNVSNGSNGNIDDDEDDELGVEV